jgi:Ca2+-binding RTX toxin-like protein
MEGGAGNDVYYIDNVGDIVSETSTLSTEIEYVYSAVSYTLGSNIENLILTGTIAITATGNSLNNTVYGNSANNIINGNEGNDLLRDNIGNDRVIGGSGNDNIYAGVGNDTLIGGIGDDIYYLSYQITDITNDTIIEDANSGIDTAYAIFTVGTLANNVEKLVLIGASAINATGNSLNNTITGNSAANILNGGAGNDTLTGGAGIDTFVLNKTSVDTITDFATTEKLQISASAFGGLTTAPLLTTQLRIGAGAISAATASQRFIFNTTDKSLYFDIDGLNGVAAVKIATISGLSTLNTTNFSFV